MRASRLLGILLRLQWKERVPARDLAEAFEVSIRTIYRDIDALSAAGVPIYAEPGRAGGVALHPGYHTKLTGLTGTEAAALPLAGLAPIARDLGMSAQAAAAQLKLMASLPPASAASASRIAERFVIDPVPWYHHDEVLPDLPMLAQAVWNGRVIRALYQSWSGQAVRRLHPLGLVQKGGLWYLVAGWRGTARLYRAAHLSALRILDHPVRRPRRFHLARFWQEAAQAFEQKLQAGRAEVRISATGEEILRAVWPIAARMAAETRRTTDKQGWSLATLPMETPAYSARQLLRLGREVEVLSPPALRQAIRAEAAATLALYRLRQ